MSRKRKNQLTAHSAGHKALHFLSSKPEKAYTLKQLSRKVHFFNKRSRKLLAEGLEKLVSENVLIHLKDGSYQYNQKRRIARRVDRAEKIYRDHLPVKKEGGLSKDKKTKAQRSKQKASDEKVHLGTIDYVNAGFAYAISDDFEEDVKIKSSLLLSALDGDTVYFKVISRNKKTRRLDGEVTEIVKRKKEEFVGIFEASKGFAFVLPDSRRMFHDIYIPLEKRGHAMNGDKVIAKIVEYSKRGKNPTGEIIKVLGEPGNNDVEMHAILLEYGLPYDFPSDVEREAKKIPQEITKEEIKRRRDLRGTTTFTIDPLDAKDFDDAISIKSLKNGRWEIGIHIADVTHYVRPGSDIEKEAYERATSIYLVDRTIPMLPEVLSNKLCSLRPHEDKLVFSAIFELDEQAKIHKQWFGRCVIHSDRRFTYEEAQEVIETGEGDYKEELLTLNTLAKRLKNQRFKEGAISFETPEVKFRLDSDGVPLEVIPKVRKDAHKLVEEFMLLANKKVAEFVYNYKQKGANNTMVYRVHENPDPEKLEGLAVFASKFGHMLNFYKGNVADVINDLNQKIENSPERDVLQSLAVRTMPKARYTTDAKGHFGLAFEHYSHFTSPIRRYPDMIAHRLLQHYLDGGNSPSAIDFEEKCKHSSAMEKLAAEAERSSIKYKQVEYIGNLQKKTFDGLVSGVTDWGIYVEITENKCEGMVRLTSLTDDFYEYDADNFCVTGKSNKKVISFGDKVKVEVVGTNLRNRTIDMILIQ